MIDIRAPESDFRLQKMEEIYADASGRIDDPHRHNYYTVLLVQNASGKHIIDYNEYRFGKMEVHFVSPGQVHQVALKEKPVGWVLTFSPEFLIQNNISESFISNINLFSSFGESPPLKLDKTIFDRLVGVIMEMETCLPFDLTYRGRALAALLQLFLIYSNNSQSIDARQLDEKNSGVCILRDFKILVESKFSNWHMVKDYSNEMHITPKHLSRTVKEITGLSAKQVIQDRLVLEAKRLLLHTQMTVKEVAYLLGYDEPLHFSGFFKKKVGNSPSEYRSINKQ